MKYSVNHICGHTETHTLYGPGKERERKLSWMETTDCSECYQAALKIQRDAENAKAAEINQANALPTLTGSEKQIAWAETIRAEKIAQLDELICAANTQIANGAAKADDPNVINFFAWAETLRNTTASSWWIDNRNISALGIIRNIAKG